MERITTAQLQARVTNSPPTPMTDSITNAALDASQEAAALADLARQLEVALIEAAESFNKISGAAIKGDSKTAMALAIGALETVRAILAKVQP